MIYVAFVLLAALITLPITTPGFYNKKNLPGALLCLLLATPSWFLGNLMPIAGGAVIAILLGMLVGVFTRRYSFIKYPETFGPGVSATSKYVLQTAIVLFGFQMDMKHISAIGARGITLILAVIVTAVLVALAVGKALGASRNERILVGVGTAICGGSAIAAATPVIKANDREVATSISIVFLFNVLAVFIFPLLGHLISMSDLRFGMWSGSAINDTSSVVAAAFSYSGEAGNAAVVVKLTRTLMIIPVTFILALFQAKKEGGAGKFQIMKVFPWFVAAFLVAGAINSLRFVPTEVSAFWGNMGRFCIMMAMAAVGLNTDIRKLLLQGYKPILLGFCCSLSVAVVSFFVLSILGV